VPFSVGASLATSKPRIGTMTDRRQGRWRLQVAVDPGLVTGERRRLSRMIHGTKSEAEDWLQRMVVDAGAGLYGGGCVTLGDLLGQFLASATLGPSTRADWVSVTEGHLKPALGETPLWELTSRDCDQLDARMKAAGLDQSRVGCAHVVLHRVVSFRLRVARRARDAPRGRRGPRNRCEPIPSLTSTSGPALPGGHWATCETFGRHRRRRLAIQFGSPFRES
jgi:hypothetical protein